MSVLLITVLIALGACVFSLGWLTRWLAIRDTSNYPVLRDQMLPYKRRGDLLMLAGAVVALAGTALMWLV